MMDHLNKGRNDLRKHVDWLPHDVEQRQRNKSRCGIQVTQLWRQNIGSKGCKCHLRPTRNTLFLKGLQKKCFPKFKIYCDIAINNLTQTDMLYLCLLSHTPHLHFLFLLLLIIIVPQPPLKPQSSLNIISTFSFSSNELTMNFNFV